MALREIGIVKWYDHAEGSGYIARKGGEDIYIHYSALRCDSEDCALREGDAVEFTLSDGSNGPQARDVIVLK